MSERPHYHHHPKEGETRSPMTEGEQRGPHQRDELDPHEPLNRPEAETPDVVGRGPELEGMGGKPPARGERRARRAMPPAEEAQ
jgi:hypothetical protein